MNNIKDKDGITIGQIEGDEIKNKDGVTVGLIHGAKIEDRNGLNVGWIKRGEESIGGSALLQLLKKK